MVSCDEHVGMCSMLAQNEASEGSIDGSVVSLVKRLASSTFAFGKDETLKLLKLAEAAKDLLRELAVELVGGPGHHQPVLVQYSADTTPVVTRKHLHASCGNLSVRRSVKSTDEFLVHQVFLTTLTDAGARKHALVYPDPIALKHGKKMPALASVALQCPAIGLTLPRPDRVQIRHQVHDRAVGLQMVCALSGFWCLQSVESREPQAHAPAPGCSNLFQWHTYVGCAAHDCHNALKWAHQSLFADAALLEAVYVAISAIRSSYYTCTDVLGSWLQQCLQPTDTNSLPDEEDLYMLWCVLGTESGLARTLAALRLLWRGGRLLIKEDVVQRKTFLEEVSTALLSLWRFPAFTASRWCTMGASCRCLAAGLLTGYGHLLQHMRNAGVVGDYVWNGFQRLDQRAIEFVFVLGPSAYLSETFLAQVLHDPRVACTQGKLRSGIEDEFAFLEFLPRKIWAFLADRSGMPAESLRSKVLSAAMISWAFIDSKVLSVAAGMPWVLCDGDVAANLKEMMDRGELPDEPVARKIFQLSQAGLNQVRLQRAVMLMGDASWTSYFTERQHASTSLVKRHHPDLGQDVLSARAFLHTFAQMMPGVSPENAWRQKMQAKICQVLKKDPSHIGGRQMFLAYTMRKAAEREADKLAQAPYKRRRIMQLHGQHWKLLRPDAKQRYENQATIQQSVAAEARRQELQTLHDQLQGGNIQQATAAAAGSMSISACALDSASLRRLHELKSRRELQGAALHKRRERASACPLPLSEAEMNRFIQESQIGAADPPCQVPDAAKLVCRMRETFREAVFCLPGCSATQWFRFLFAVQSPFQIFLLPLEEAAVNSMSSIERGSDPDSCWSSDVDWCWQFTAGQFVSAAVFEGVQLESMAVILHSTFVEPGILHSRDVLQPLEPIVTALLPDLKRPCNEKAKASAVAAPSAQLLAKHPWLAAVASSSSSARSSAGSM